MSKEKVEIGEICEFIRGVTFDGNEVLNEKTDDYIPILRAGNIGETLDFQNDLVWVPSKRVSKEQYFQIDDIAICMASGSPAVLGKTAQLKKSFIGSIGAFCGIIRVKKANPKFVAYWFRSANFMAWRDVQAMGVNIQNLRPTEVLAIKMPFPPLSEQRRIADILSKADRLRQLRRTARAMGETYLQSVFYEMFGDPIENPKRWKLEEIGNHTISIRYGTGSPPNYIEKGIPFIRATNIKQGSIQEKGMVYISEEDAKEISKCKIKTGDLILVRSGINVGDCATVQKKFNGAYAAYDLIVEVPYPTNYFINFLINSSFGKATINTMSRRAAQPHVNADQIKSMKLPFPDKKEQDRFAKIIRQYNFLNSQQREAERQAEMLFQSLLQQAFEGEL